MTVTLPFGRRHPYGMYEGDVEGLGLQWVPSDLPPGLTLTLRTSRAEIVASLSHDASGLRVRAVASAGFDPKRRSKADDLRTREELIHTAAAWIAENRKALLAVDWTRDMEALRADPLSRLTELATTAPTGVIWIVEVQVTGGWEWVLLVGDSEIARGTSDPDERLAEVPYRGPSVGDVNALHGWLGHEPTEAELRAARSNRGLTFGGEQ